MRNIPGKVTGVNENGDQEENFLFTYDEGERQKAIEDAHNAEILWRPEFISFPIKEWEENDLSIFEGLLFGFMKFYLTNNMDFYWNNKKLAKLFKTHEDHVGRAVRSLTQKGLISLTRRPGRSSRIRLIKPLPPRKSLLRNMIIKHK